MSWRWIIAVVGLDEEVVKNERGNGELTVNFVPPPHEGGEE